MVSTITILLLSVLCFYLVWRAFSPGLPQIKSLADAAWNQFISLTIGKAEDAGRTVILVDPRNTSKMCSQCGELVVKTLRTRTHTCPHCGLVRDRDVNAALNILQRGLQTLNR